jgi:hypothetical protein
MFKVLKLHTIFCVFSGKIFFCSEFSSFEAVNWGFSGGVCQKFSKGEPPPNLPLGGGNPDGIRRAEKRFK